MKQQLLDLYLASHADYIRVCQQFPNAALAGPFLISPNELYAKQSIPLLVVGQETKGWSSHLDDLAQQMNTYEAFNVGQNYRSGKHRHESPFWNITRKLERVLGNQPYSSAWTNVSKYDLNQGRSYGEMERAIAMLDYILLKEIQILQPTVCLFYTGPDFDYRLRDMFTSLEFVPVSGYTVRQFCQLKHEALPELTFRSYHPNYLRRSKREDDFVAFMTNLAK